MVDNIGNYKILKKIGAGGMAQVYLAVHQDVPNLKVVLKVLSDPRLVERFKQEADKLALLDGHGHICQIKHFFSQGDEIVIAMEYIDGSTLEDMIKKEGQLEIDTALHITGGVLETLAFAHNKGIYHRDIKPGNIMVDGNGQVKIIDFGIAKGESDPNLTIAGSSCGTPAYMPPEQFNPSADINYGLTDIYAIGTTLYFMLTGELPFKGDNAFALRDAKLFEEPTPPRKINPAISKEVEAIILKSMAIEPSDRFATVDDMRAAIEALQPSNTPADLTPHVQKTQAAAAADDRTAKPAKKGGRRLLIPIAALAVIIAALFSFVFFGGGDEPPAAPTLQTPAADATVDDATPRFAWLAQGDDLRFTLEISDDVAFSSPQVMSDLAAPDYTPPVDMADGVYYWRVRAVDADNRVGAYSPATGFTIATIVEPPPTGYADISVRPSGDIYIDDELIARNSSRAAATVDTGWHYIKAVNSRSTQKQFTDSVYFAADDSTSRRFTFTMPTPTPEKTYGEIRVGSKPIIGALVFIDGQLQERRTNTTFRLTTGRHIVKAILTIDDNEMEKTDTVLVESGGSHKLIFDFEN